MKHTTVPKGFKSCSPIFLWRRFIKNGTYSKHSSEHKVARTIKLLIFGIITQYEFDLALRGALKMSHDNNNNNSYT